MSSLYIHIPFCKQACHYCDFHFSTSIKKKGELVGMLCEEIRLRKNELPEKQLDTVYFGGGTPSLLSSEELKMILDSIDANFEVRKDAEITLEANPDDLSLENLKTFKNAGINRLSIGVQSFFEEDLQLMNRAHNATEALESIQMAKQFFENISIDLIYGIPGMSNERWKTNIETALSLGLPHFSCYALTIEPNTALKKMIEKGKVKPVDDEAARMHFDILTTILKEEGFTHYEFSNYGKQGYFSENNTAYWFGKPYLGIGPSAHSYDGKNRKWNINNNTLYIKAIEKGELPFEKEELSTIDRYNEYVMTRLRTMWGINIKEIGERFGNMYKAHFLNEASKEVELGLLEQNEDSITVTQKGKFLSDGIASNLFFIN
ncbi:oxygen-independent coproporphyrinogen-3 oxidase [Gillisia sp. Hel_I_86]|uniref:radical SAM family heme chaperone HemW n=1 Tax=Gillisia sp. Hel_I_86 TaxID=1249981 RepID=UPI0011994EC3|nr:radical SAM family heme chaperone HemW [Gillisia sp. Hel_I_86]TVZ25809.1 oxygen-independent coproporphyrinogen-3 oxidase [Gillisia sp. Hel_I_86]